MKSYQQSCPIAQSLDVVGDRWTLLIIRELVIQGPCRYTDMAHGLPGIATSVLSDRLRSLEESGLIYREVAPPPIASTLFHLTEQGRALEPILVALGRWGLENLDQPEPDSEGRIHWLPFAASILLRGRISSELPLVIQLVTPFGSGVIDVADGSTQSRVGTAVSPDLTLTGGPDLIVKFLSGKESLTAAKKQGLQVDGDVEILSFPSPSR